MGGAPRRHFYGQDLPIIFWDGSLPFLIVAKKAEARSITYLRISFVSCVLNFAL